ncbi:MAG: hypothetical protein ACUZ8O_08180 [Candidatus Anammoxibacter sp.]
MKNEKKFDSVKMMRKIRDKLSDEFRKLNYEGQQKYIEGNLKDKTMQHKEEEVHIA